MNFVIDLLESEGCDVILIMIDRLMKMRHYIVCKTEEEETSAK